MTATPAPATQTHIAPGKYQIMPPMSAEEFAELKADIKANGVKVPIEFDPEDNVLDGHHRFAAWGELISEGHDIPMFDKIVRKFETEEQKWAHVIAINVKRRHLSAEQRQQLILQLRMPPFSYTMQQIANTVGASVATVWRDLDDAPDELREELRNLQIKGADGIVRSTTYAPRMFFTGETQLRHIEAQVQGQAQQDAHNAALAATAAAQGGGAEPGAVLNSAPSAGSTTRYAIMVTCKDEAEQSELLELLLEQGRDVRALVL